MVSSSYTKIVVVAPAGTGAIDVIVKTAGGDMTHSSKYTYTDTGIAKISGVSPNSGPVGESKPSLEINSSVISTRACRAAAKMKQKMSRNLFCSSIIFSKCPRITANLWPFCGQF